MVGREATVTIPVKEWRKAQKRVEEQAKRFQENNARQVDIINRLMEEASGKSFIIGILAERLFETSLVNLDEILITKQDITEHDPSKITIINPGTISPDETNVVVVIKKEN